MSERPNEDAQAEYLRTHPEAKPSNPKDAFGSAKVPVGLCPDTAITEMALSFLEGALKYGRYNWRVIGVRASIYNDAMERHRKKWWNGQDRDPVTRVRELASVMACCAILIDSEICGVLEDDRPPLGPLGTLLDANMEVVAHLKDLFKDHNPKQYTWVDSPQLAKLNESMQEGLADALRPEGFPDGYSMHTATGAELDAMAQLSPLKPCVPPPPFTIPIQDSGPLTLACGCVKRCKGHAVSEAAAAVDVVLTGPKDPSGRPYSTKTEDAEFPQPPPVHRPVEAAREFDPAD